MISRNLALRLLIAAIFIPLLIYLFKLGGKPFLIFFEVLTILSLWEFFRLTSVKLFSWQEFVLLLTALVPGLLVYSGKHYFIETAVFVLFLSTLPHVFSKSLGDLSKSIGLILFGFVYVTLGYSSVILIRSGSVVDESTAGNWLVFLFATIWIVDTAGYYFGSQLGKGKLSPVISPNKTWVGFWGGFVGAIITAALFNFIFLQEIGFLKLVAPALIIAFFGQLGDLVESIFKREAGKKDSSSLIPGHGGVLDRFDSLMFAAPALYAYLRFLS